MQCQAKPPSKNGDSVFCTYLNPLFFRPHDHGILLSYPPISSTTYLAHEEPYPTFIDQIVGTFLAM